MNLLIPFFLLVVDFPLSTPVDDAQKHQLDERNRLEAKANLLIGQSKYREAIALVEQMLAIERKVHGEAHAEVAGSLRMLLLLNEKVGEFDLAEKYAQEHRDTVAAVYGDKHWRVANATWNLKHIAISRKMSSEDRVRFKLAGDLERDAMSRIQEGRALPAIELLVRSVAIRKQMLGDHPLVATGLNGVGYSLSLVGRFDQSRVIFEQAIAMLRRVYSAEQTPGGHPSIATALTNLGQALNSLGKLEEAMSAQRESIEIQTSIYPVDKFPDGHPDLALGHNNLGLILHKQGKFLEAREHLVQALKMREQLYPKGEFPKGHQLLAMSLRNLAESHITTGELTAARGFLERALGMQEQLYPETQFEPGHPHIAYSLNSLGTVLQKQGEFSAAREYFERALAMLRRLYPTEDFPNGHPELAKNLNDLGLLLYHQGLYDKAREHLEAALKMDKGSSDRIKTLTNLGGIYWAEGSYAQARRYEDEALQLSKRIYSPDKYPSGHANLAMSLNNMATLLAEQGEHKGAVGYYEEALEMFRKIYPERDHPNGHPDLAMCLNNLGLVHHRTGRFDEALRCHNEAFAIRTRVFDSETYPDGHPAIALSLNNLALAYFGKANKSAAVRHARAAVEMRKKLYRPDLYPHGHPLLAMSLTNLATLHIRGGALSRAKSLQDEADRMFRLLYPVSSYPKGHPTLVRSQHQLGRIAEASGDNASAGRHYEETLTMQQDLAELFFTMSSEAESLNLIANGLPLQDHLITFWLNNGRSPEELYRHIWRAKGLIYRVMTRRHQLLSVQKTEQVQALLSQYVETRRILARRALSPSSPSPAKMEARRAELSQLSDRKEKLERQLSDAIPEFHRIFAAAQVDPQELSHRLPERTAFVDILRYNHVSHIGNRFNAPRQLRTQKYIAFIVSPGKPIALVQLGEADDIDRAVARWRKDISERVISPAGQTVRRLVWDPIAEKLPAGTDSLLICPDGQLTALAWGALPGSNRDRFLLEEFAFSTVPYGPFILHNGAATKADQGSGTVLAVGDIDYDQRPDKPPEQSGSLALRGGIPADRPLHWEPLKGTAAELEFVTKMASTRRVVQLRGRAAGAAQVLKNLPKANWAHIATHGFFADSRFRSALRVDSDRVGPDELWGMQRTTVIGRNPLVLAGLVFAGANRPPEFASGDGASETEGVVTAEAIAGLPLHQLDLAVLSACETGLGEVAGGEGVFGLQRAFHIAGASTVIASLWKVNDTATQDLMAEFYKNLWTSGLSKRESLRRAQLELIESYNPKTGKLRGLTIRSTSTNNKPNHASRLPPHYWAAFTLSGDWR